MDFWQIQHRIYLFILFPTVILDREGQFSGLAGWQNFSGLAGWQKRVPGTGTGVQIFVSLSALAPPPPPFCVFFFKV
jgi:hypothetical protein